MAPTRAPIHTQYGAKNTSGLKFELPSFSFGQESIVAGTSIPEPERELTPLAKPQLDTVMTSSSDNQSPDPLRSHPTTPGNSTPTGPPAKVASNGAGPTSTPRSVTTTNTGVSQQASNVQTSVSSGMSPPPKRPGVRKLLSLRSLSSSFSSHGRSDSQMSGMTNVSGSDFGGPSRSQTPSLFGRKSSSLGNYARPGTSGGQSVADSTATGKPSLRKRVSGAFWNRRSSLMMSNMIDESAEDGLEVGHSPGATGKENTGARGNALKRGKPAAPPPQLPEIGSLKVSKGLKDTDDGFLNSKELFSGVRYKREVSAEEMATIKKQRIAR